jgi:uncharacterized SAM-binding protein YcdF (DUF218 family)
VNAPQNQADTAVCVLGCRIGSEALGRRVRAAAEAWRALSGHVGGKVVACGGRRWDGIAEADAMARLLHDDGVPDAKIVRESRSLDTFENASEAAKICADKPVILVTCEWHLPRARLLFERAGIVVVRGIGVPPPDPGLWKRAWWHAREWFSTWKDLHR